MINGKKINTGSTAPKILIAPLDWGLGHATRCIPIINELIKQGCEVLIAASNGPYYLLKKEFPTTVFLRLDGYKIQYTRNNNWLFFKLLIQFPGVVLSVWKEKVWLQNIIDERGIDAVISDNRFGIHDKRIPCVYITHQLRIKTGNAFFDKIARHLHYHFIKKFSNCWVPDCKENALAGDLSQEVNTPFNVSYLGPLSRFEKINNIAGIYDVLISLSGPEPQRTIFEKIILDQLPGFNRKVLLVRGLPGENKTPKAGAKCAQIVNHLSSDELNVAFQQASMIISRSGYSTVMDLVKLGKNAILVPTPGQTEQQYLSWYLMKKKYFYSTSQDNFSLETALQQASSFPYTRPEIPLDGYKKVISEFVLSLKSGNFAPQ